MPLNKRRSAIAAIMAACSALAACTGGTIYDSYKHMRGWERTDTAMFPVPAVPTGGTYTISIGLRINAHYPFTGICMIVDQRILPAGTVHSDTLNCKLTDGRGQALGNGLSNYQYLFDASRLKLREGDSLVVAVRHCMKRETLPGIEDIGVKVDLKQAQTD